jgi:hypothetical protein
VVANLSYAMNRNGLNFTDHDRDLSVFNTVNFNNTCFGFTNNVNLGKYNFSKSPKFFILEFLGN